MGGEGKEEAQFAAVVMKYTVLISISAEEEMAEAFDWLAPQTPQNAPLWYNRVVDAILSLEEMAGRCPIIEESNEAGESTRQLLVGDKRHGYRILFSIRGDKVIITSVRHGLRKKK